MIERLNAATNLIGMFLVLVGAALAFKRPDIGASIITGAFGLLAGKHIAESANGSGNGKGPSNPSAPASGA